MPARPGNKRGVLNLVTSVKALGVKQAQASLGKLVSVIDTFFESNKKSRFELLQHTNEMLKLSARAHKLAPDIMEVEQALDKYQSTVEEIIRGERTLSDLSDKKIEDIDLVWKKYSELSKRIQKSDFKFAPEAEENWVKRGESFALVLDQHERLQKVIGVVSAATDKFGQVSSEVFGALVPQGVGDANIVFDAFKNSLKSGVGTINKILESVGASTPGAMLKKKGSEWLMKRFGLDDPAGAGAGLRKKFDSLFKNVSKSLKEKHGKLGNIEEWFEKSPIRKKAGGNIAGSVSRLKEMRAAEAATSGASRGMMFYIKSISRAVAASGPFAVALIAIASAAAALLVQIKLLTEGFKKFIEYEEEFRTTGFRAAGSIHELINSSMDLSIATGLNTGDMIKLNKAMLEAGITGKTLADGVKTQSGETLKGTEALKKLSTGVAKYTTATGASAETTAQFTKHMMRAGATVDQNEAAMGGMAIAAKKFGLTGKDLDGIMGQLNKNMFTLQSTFNSTPRDIRNYANEAAALSGVAKQLGANLSTVQKIMQDIADLNDTALTMAALGGQMDAMFSGSPEEKLAAYQAGGMELISMMKDMDHVSRTAMMKEMGVSQEMLDVLEKRNEMSEAELKTMQRREDAQKALDSSFQESTKTMKMLFQRILTPIMALFTKFAEPIIAGIEEMMAAFQNGENVFGGFKGMFENFGGLAKDLFGLFKASKPIFSAVFTVFKFGAQVLNLVVGAVRFLIKILKPLVTLFMLFTPLGRAISAVLVVINVLVGLLSMVGNVVEYVGSVLGALVDLFTDTDAALIKLAEADKKFKEGFGEGWDIIKAPFVWLFDMLGSIWNMLFVGNSPSLIDVVKMFFTPFATMGKIAGNAINFMKDAFAKLYEPLVLVGKAIYDFLVSPFDYIIGLFDRALTRVKQFAKDAFDFLKDIPIVEGIGGMIEGVGEMLGFQSGGTVPTDGPILAHQGEEVINRSLSIQLENFLGWWQAALKPEDYSPAYTVKYTNDVKSNESNKLSEISDQLRELNVLMGKLVDKDDPNTARAADTLEEIARNADSTNEEYNSLRSRYGIGEQAVQWGLNK